MHHIDATTCGRFAKIMLRSALLGTSATLAITTAHAQTAPATDSTEIVVTAEKRASTVQKTPISMTALSGQDIVARGATDFDKLAADVPGIAEHTSGPGQTEFELRGLSSSGGAAPTVGFYLDETPLTAAAFTQNGKVVIDPNLYDISRVEVLRGPQGTLYGSGSMGGTIKLVTNQPNLDKLEASSDGMISQTDNSNGINHNENAMINVPVVPGVLAVRLVGSLSYADGWINRVVVGNPNSATDWLPTNNGDTRWNVLSEKPTQVIPDVNSTTGKSFRVTATWKPSENLTFTPMFMYQDTSQGGYSAYDSTPGITNESFQPTNVPESISDQFRLGSLVAKYNGNGFDVTSSTAYWHRTENQLQDATEALNEFFYTVGAGTGSPYAQQGGTGVSVNNEIDTSKQFSEELRISSNSGGKFNWLAGVFYSDFHSTFDLTENTPSLTSSVLDGEVGGTATDGSNLITIDEPIHIKQTAVFGEASYKFSDALKFTAGLRWYDFNTTATSFQNGVLFEGASTISGVNLYNASIPLANSNKGINPKFNLSWTPDRNLLVYATASKGFRQSGVNQPSGASCGATPLTYNPDSVWNYEAGEKGKLLGGRITINTDAYVDYWKNVQSFILLPACGFSYSTNGPDAKVYGGEAELTLKLIAGATAKEGLSLTENLAYAHAAYTGNDPALNLFVGSPMVNIPKETMSVGASYVQEVKTGLTGSARINYNIVGARQQFTQASTTVNSYGTFADYLTLPSYALTDLRFALQGDKWTASLFVNNLTDKHAELGTLNINSFNLNSYSRIVTNQPRTVGLDISVKY